LPEPGLSHAGLFVVVVFAPMGGIGARVDDDETSSCRKGSEGVIEDRFRIPQLAIVFTRSTASKVPAGRRRSSGSPRTMATLR
jgi:hypothetical protein